MSDRERWHVAYRDPTECEIREQHVPEGTQVAMVLAGEHTVAALFPDRQHDPNGWGARAAASEMCLSHNARMDAYEQAGRDS